MRTNEQNVQRERILKRIALLSPEKREEIEKLVKNRVNLHRAQKPETLDLEGDIMSGENAHGVRWFGRTSDEPDRMESKYVMTEVVDKKGRQRAAVVTLRVWEDWNCYEAVMWNRGMVARACTEVGRGITFSTRMQTDVQTTSIMMWMLLRGRLFYDADTKGPETSLYFDAKKNLMWRIDSPEFRTWIQCHSHVNSCRADFDHLMSAINANALNPEVSRPCRPRALFNRRTIDGKDFIYISCGDSWMMRIGASKDGSAIERVPNGTDDVVFLTGQTLGEWEFKDDSPGEDPFLTCAPFSTANYESPHGAMILRLWILSLAACQAAFPAMLMTGKARSGKTRLAKAVFELFGIKHRAASIDPGPAGKKDFWTIENADGIVNYDNVDTRNDWFEDAIQQACTDGSFESRTLFKDGKITTLRARARIIMTANNPLFAAASGLTDRLQIVRLTPFDGKNGKEVSDSALTVEIESRRDEILTWIARTISKALADVDPVDGNVCFRHPDYASFALRCARALPSFSSDGDQTLYSSAVMSLKSAEFDKARLTIQSVKGARLILEALEYYFTKKYPVCHEYWIGRATQMMELITESHDEINVRDGKSGDSISAQSVGYYLEKYIEQLSVLFDIGIPNKVSGCGVEYTFKSFSVAYKSCVLDYSKNLTKTENEENYPEELPF